MTTQSPVLSAYGVRKRSVRSRFLFRRLSSHVVAVVAVVGVVAAVVVVAFVSAVDKKKKRRPRAWRDDFEKNRPQKSRLKKLCTGLHKLNLSMVYFRAWHPGGFES